MNKLTERFGTDVFSADVMAGMLAPEVYQALMNTRTLGVPLGEGVAQAVADAMKAWAIEKGATHYTHWFQPLTGVTAEKHDSFLTADAEG